MSVTDATGFSLSFILFEDFVVPAGDPKPNPLEAFG